MVTKLPKKLRWKGDPEVNRVYTFGKEIQKIDGGYRYVLYYINHDYRECAFLTESYANGFDYVQMLRNLNEDVNWEEVK